MASTNKTKELKLSQYINSDRPSYLQDYNEDMRKIDDFAGKALQKDTGWKITELFNTSNEHAGYMCFRRIGNIVYLFLAYNASKDTYFFDFDEPVPEGFRPSSIEIKDLQYANSIDTVVCFNVATNNICKLRYGYTQYKLGLSNQSSSQTNFNVNVSTSWITDDEYPEEEME